MSAPNFWQELFTFPARSAADNLPEQASRLEWLACIAECQGERLSAGITAISELLESAANSNRVDDGAAVDVCLMLLALSGLSAQLAAVSCNANNELANIRAAMNHSTATPHQSPVSQD
ncbi:hypothetical protein SAMN05216206_2160 [Pseudomonas guineae]|uniref:Uncharacterized protein n=1 Tax=Pseudomonas guineae TaxID=425504 RepID=A0A1I3HZ53_9PSED|nr:hypothetical protein [Pseudomonas guineae]SFI40893.1 hypothetical protein SAMN05216206_2160 [Pseudomonas guineae]